MGSNQEPCQKDRTSEGKKEANRRPQRQQNPGRVPPPPAQRLWAPKKLPRAGKLPSRDKEAILDEQASHWWLFNATAFLPRLAGRRSMCIRCCWCMCMYERAWPYTGRAAYKCGCGCWVDRVWPCSVAGFVLFGFLLALGELE